VTRGGDGWRAGYCATTTARVCPPLLLALLADQAQEFAPDENAFALFLVVLFLDILEQEGLVVGVEVLPVVIFVHPVGIAGAQLPFKHITINIRYLHMDGRSKESKNTNTRWYSHEKAVEFNNVVNPPAFSC
jgi:hypothetical protein